MKFIKLVGFTILLMTLGFPVIAITKAECEVQYFIGTGKTSELSFSMCKEVMVTQTFRQEFIMNCQQGLVTFVLKQEPEVRYMQLGEDGTPVHCKRS